MQQCPLSRCGLRMLPRHDGGRDTSVVSSPFPGSPSTSCWLKAPQPTSGGCHKHRGWGLHLGLPSQRSAQDPKDFPHEDVAPLQAALERGWKRAVARAAPFTAETNQGREANPASSAQTAESWIQHNRGDNRDKLSAVGPVVGRQQCSMHVGHGTVTGFGGSCPQNLGWL